jgi:hypothetical protein
MTITVTDVPLVIKSIPSINQKTFDNYSVCPEDQKHFEKIKKYCKTTKKNWSTRKLKYVPLNIPTLADNRYTEFNKIFNHAKDGFDPGIFQAPVVVAIPASIVKDAIAKRPTLITEDLWDIRPEGFIKIDGNDYYAMVCDGRHRQVLEAAHQQHPPFNNFSDLTGDWECQVTFANANLLNDPVDEFTKWFQLSHKLYIDINNKKIRKPSSQDNLGAEIRMGDKDAIANIDRMKKTGFWVEGGQRPFGDPEGVKTKYSIFRRDALKDPRLNDSLILQTSKWIKLDPDFDKNVTYSPSLAPALALAIVVEPKILDGNGTQTAFESWLKEQLGSNSSEDLVSYWKELGGNQDNKYSESICLGMFTDWKSTKLKKSQKSNLKNKSVYHYIVLDKIEDKLFPKKVANTTAE